ncbi:MAG TPA: TolC family protein [Kiritimatiellia bacterium]|nr:TolC family protein [Kiritimatiellia bacterium]
MKVLPPCFLAILFFAYSAHGQLSLEQCIAEALDNNPDLNAALHRLDAASASIQSARSGWYPQITASGTYTRTDNPPQAFFMNLNQRNADLANDFNQPDVTDNFRASLGFRMLVADGGLRSLSIDTATLRKEAEKHLTAAAQNELVFQVSRAYFTLAQAIAMVDVEHASLRSISENLRIARSRHEHGSGLLSDVLQLEVDMAEAEVNVSRALNRVELAIAALNASVGSVVADRNTSLTPDVISLDPVDFEVDAMLAMERPEYKGLAREAEAMELEMKQNQRRRLPRLYAFGSVDWDSDSLSGFEDSYLVGAALEIDLFRGFKTRAEIAIADARRREAQARADSTRNQMILELDQARLNAREAWSRIAITAKGAVSALEAHRIVQERYEQGSSGIAELLAAQSRHASAQYREVAATYDYLIAKSALKRALGAYGTADHATGEKK